MDWGDRRVRRLAYASMLAFFVWLVFILLYALYWSTGFTFFQNLVVSVVSFLITAGVVGVLWMVLGMKYANPVGA